MGKRWEEESERAAIRKPRVKAAESWRERDRCDRALRVCEKKG